MMYFGIAEVMMMLFFGGFLPNDLEPLPADQVVEYLPVDCEIMGYVDLRGASTAIDTFIGTLQSQEWLLSMPEIGELITTLPELLNQGQAEATTMLGFNPFTDLSAVSFCVNLTFDPARDFIPDMVLVARGTFPQGTDANLAGMIGMLPTDMGNGLTLYQMAGDGVMLSLMSPTPDVLLAGTQELVQPFASGSPSMVAREDTTLLARVQAVAAGGGVHSVIGFQLSDAAREFIASEVPTTLAQLLTGMQRAVVTTHGQVSSIEITAADEGAFRDYELILRGIGEYSMGFNYLARAALYIMAGVLSPDDPELPEELRMLVSRREEILAFVDEWLLGAPPEVTFNADPASATVSLSTSSQTSLQTTMMTMGVLSGMLIMRAEAPEPYPMEEVEPVYQQAP